MKRTLSIWFHNRFSALPRITGLFSGKGFPVESMAVGVASEDGVTRMTLTTLGDDSLVERITKQLHRLIDVIQVVELASVSSVERELALVKVQSSPARQQEIVQLADVFRGRVVDMGARTVTVELTGRAEKINAAIDRFSPYGVVEFSRSGAVALKRDDAPERVGKTMAVTPV